MAVKKYVFKDKYEKISNDYEEFCQGKLFEGKVAEIEYIKHKFPKYSDYRIAKSVIKLEGNLCYNDTKAYYTMHFNVYPEIASIIVLIVSGMTNRHEIKRMSMEERLTWVHLFGD